MSIPERYLRSPRTASPDQSAREAARRMREHRVGALIVVDPGDRPVGLVTDRDLVLRVLKDGKDPETTCLDELMSQPVVTVNRNASLLEATAMIRRHLVRRLPVVDEAGRACGMITADDLLFELADELKCLAEAERRGLENEAKPAERTWLAYGKE